MTERARKIGYRLAYLVPMTPWPVVFWLRTFPVYSFGFGSKNALAAVGTALPLVLLGTTLLGLVLIVRSRANWEDVGVWLVFAVVHHFVLFGYIVANTFVQSVK